jgi:hypothetical protein
VKNAYLGLAILGAVVPYYFFAQFFGSADTGLGAFTTQLFATPPAAGFTTDLLITSLAFWIWSYVEAKRRGMRFWWAYVATNLAVGLSFAFPLFLYVRERRKAAGAGV